MSSVKNNLVKHLKQATEIDIKNVYFAFDYPVIDEVSPNHPCSRIIMPLSGKKKILASIDGKVSKITMQKGDILFTVKYGWTDEFWEVPHKVFSIIFHDLYTRVVFIDNEKPRLSKGWKIWHHTSSGISDSGWHIISALNSLARDKRRSPQDGLLLKALIAETINELEYEKENPHGKAYHTFTLIKEYMHEHYHEPINRDTTCAELDLNPSYASRLFKEISGKNFNSYLNQLRLEQASNLLLNTNMTAEEISYKSGFTSLSYFSRIFKKRFGKAPGGYRNTTRI